MRKKSRTMSLHRYPSASAHNPYMRVLDTAAVPRFTAGLLLTSNRPTMGTTGITTIMATTITTMVMVSIITITTTIITTITADVIMMMKMDIGRQAISQQEVRAAHQLRAAREVRVHGTRAQGSLQLLHQGPRRSPRSPVTTTASQRQLRLKKMRPRRAHEVAIRCFAIYSVLLLMCWLLQAHCCHRMNCECK